MMRTRILRYLTIGLPVLAIVCMALYALSAGEAKFVMVALAHFLLISCAAFALGGVAGFLLALPARAVAANQGDPAAPHLEQIADWLVKVLIGAGLTQLQSIGQGLSVGLERVTGLMSDGTVTTLGKPGPFIAALAIFFTLYGFVLAYFLFKQERAKNQST